MIYRITLSGEKILVKLDDGESLCGFVKNEYVWASSKEKAILKAKERIQSALSANPAVRILNDVGITFNVDEVEAGVAPWKLLSGEGFVFYKLD